MNQEPIRRRKLYEEILERLMQRISSGEFSPGDHLPSERELMEQYGVGRVAVREALQELARSGIVEISHGERARVVVPTASLLVRQIGEGARHLLRMRPESLEHLKDARVFLEVGLARVAAREATPAHLEALRERLQAQRDAVADPVRFLECDMAFHRELATVGGNPIFPAIVEALFAWAAEYYQSIVRAPGAEALTLAEHQAIVDAVAARDPERAAQAMRDHLTRASSLYRQFGA